MSDKPAAATVLAAFVRRAWLEASHHRVTEAIRAVGTVVLLASLGYLGRLVDAGAHPSLARYGTYAGFLIVGFAVADLQRAAAGSLSRRLREAQLEGTLDAVLATPAPTWSVVAGTVLPDVLGTLLRATVYVLVGALAFGVRLGPARPAALVAVVLAATGAFLALGLLGGAVTLLLRRADPFTLVVDAASFVAGGLLYPRDVLPGWLRAVGESLPITPALAGLRGALLAGDGLAAVAPALARLGLFVALAGGAGVLAFAAALRRSRADGTLSTY